MLNLLKYNFNKKFWSGVPKKIHSIKKKKKVQKTIHSIKLRVSQASRLLLINVCSPTIFFLGTKH